MRVLHVVKTADGAAWAAHQAAELVGRGVDVHVALPSLDGAMLPRWHDTGATLHEADLDLGPGRPAGLIRRLGNARALVAELRPDLIHSHFVGTTLLLRLALGLNHPTPRIFQVPGPLHLEHAATLRLELATAGPADRWIASSRVIADHYRRAGIEDERVFLSYYGTRLPEPGTDGAGAALRAELGLPDDAFVAGNISYVYPPRRYLGQRIGLKGHEVVIEAVAGLLSEEPRLRGLLVGGQFGGGEDYLGRLRELAGRRGAGRILMPGPMPPDKAPAAWSAFDCALHVPLSENCGGVVEPLLAGVPVIASHVGGLPEVIFEGVTGRLVPPRDPDALAWTLRGVMAAPEAARETADRGRALVRTMFDAARTAREVHGVYRHLLEGAPRPESFDAREFLGLTGGEVA